MRTSVLIVAEAPVWQQRFRASVGACAHMRLVGVAGSCVQAQVLLDLQATDVVVMDLHLLDAQGLDLLHYAAQQHPRSQVLVVADCADDLQVWAAIEAGAAGYLLRHTAADNLCASIQDVMAGGSPMSPEIARRVLQRLRENLHGSATGAAACTAPLAALTSREIEVLNLMAQGLSFDDMGAALFLSPHTVVAHVKHIYRKLAVHSRGEAVYKAQQAHLL